MPIRPPTLDQLKSVAEQCGMAMPEEELKAYLGLMQPRIDAYNKVDAMVDDVPEVKYPRTPGYRPMPTDDPHNAWYRKTSIQGAANGKLKGKRVAIKDSVMVAGVPMANGSATLEGFVPDLDATVVTRVLDAGAEIVGKTNCECLCMSAGSHTSAFGLVHNPYKMGYTSGGSSSGSAVAVALGEADMAIGCDQGGSIRIPSAMSGVVGLKPTYGLVPYTGAMPIEILVDHIGPMTKTVADNALMLEVIAGDDGYDPRIKSPKLHEYTKSLGGGVKGLKIGLLKEGFEDAAKEETVNEKVRAAAKQLEKLGAEVATVSIPIFKDGPIIYGPIIHEGTAATMWWGDGMGCSRNDLYPVAAMDRHHAWRTQSANFSHTARFVLLHGTFMLNTYGTRYYGKAVNIVRRLRRAYDEALEKCDLLLLPTTPMKAKPFPSPDSSLSEYCVSGLEMLSNTMSFDLTHHPALSIPCGMADGLPIGMMLVGKHFDEPTIYRAAHAFEQSGDWKRM